MKPFLTLAAMATVLGAFASPAFAGVNGPGLGITNPDLPFTIGRNVFAGASTVHALYLYNDAADLDTLSLTGFAGGQGAGCGPGNAIFANHTGSGCTDSGNGNGLLSGATASIDLTGLTSGQILDFFLTNTNTGVVYHTGPGSTNVAYDITNSTAQLTADLNLPAGAFSAATTAALLALGSASNTVVLAFEDLSITAPAEPTGSQDFNDLIFAFAPTSAPVPEPASLALLGAGLASLGFLRRRKNA